MDRRSFLKAILGAAAYEPAKKIFVFAPACGWNSSLIVPGESMFFLESTAHGYNDWSYRYAYRNSITGHTSDIWAKPLPLAEVNKATFGISPDLVDIYRRLPGTEDFEYAYSSLVGA